jgi:hypothetical protein
MIDINQRNTPLWERTLKHIGSIAAADAINA